MSQCTPIKAVICDMDGTLFDPQHKISPQVIRVLKELKTRGIYFIVATGRPYPDVFATIDGCGLEPDYIVTSNGARMHDGASRKVITAHNLDPAAVCRLFQIPGSPDAHGELVPITVADEAAEGAVPSYPPKQFAIHVNHEDEGLTDKVLKEVQVVFHPTYQYRLVDPMTYTPEQLQGTHSMWVRGDHEVLEGLQKYMEKNLSDSLHAVFALPFVIDIALPHMNKGVALREAAQLLNLSLDEFAAFGDGMNDVAMLELAGKSYVMANGAEALKKAVPRATVIRSNAEDGVARQLCELFDLPYDE